jgi:HlyD family secretion protein
MKRAWFVAGLLAMAGCGLGGDQPDGSGTIECTQVQVAPLVGGRILELPPQEGDAIRAGDLVTQIDPQDTKLQRDEAAAALHAAEADFLRIGEVFRKKSATEKQMDDAKAACDAARARLALAEKAVADCTVTSPISGIVTTRIREEGEVVGPGAPLITVSRLDEVWLSVYIPESRLGKVKLGGSATVKIDGDAKTYSGTITFVSPEAEFTPRNVQTPEERVKLVYRVKITLPNPDGVFKPGMPADGYLEAR